MANWTKRLTVSGRQSGWTRKNINTHSISFQHLREKPPSALRADISKNCSTITRTFSIRNWFSSSDTECRKNWLLSLARLSTCLSGNGTYWTWDAALDCLVWKLQLTPDGW